jgi:hypothetical protein
MTTYTDLSIYTDNAYKLADLVDGGHYDNIFYYEFHEEVDPKGIYDCIEGLKKFQKQASDSYKIFLSYDYVDELPAVIHVALKVRDEWFIARECGSNFYLGYGPSGILKLRKACADKNVTAFASDENFDDWIKKKFGKPGKPLAYERKSADTLQFEKLCKALRYLTVDMQRRPQQFQGLTEENIRDKMLTPINVSFKGRGHAESKNRKGKTDILVRTKDGLNEHIFELKVWKGISTLEEAIEQLLGYISSHNNYCGIIMFSYNKNFTAVLGEAEKYLQEKNYFDKREKFIENEFRFRLPHQTDIGKSVQTHLTFINLNCKK